MIHFMGRFNTLDVIRLFAMAAILVCIILIIWVLVDLLFFKHVIIRVDNSVFELHVTMLVTSNYIHQCHEAVKDSREVIRKHFEIDPEIIFTAKDIKYINKWVSDLDELTDDDDVIKTGIFDQISEIRRGKKAIKTTTRLLHDLDVMQVLTKTYLYNNREETIPHTMVVRIRRDIMKRL